MICQSHQFITYVQTRSSLEGWLSSRYFGNLRYLQEVYQSRKDWMLEPFQKYGQEWVLEPLRNQTMELEWAGEYAGKWLDAASLVAKGSKDERLNHSVTEFTAELIAAQQPDGYLGIEAPPRRGKGWDLWNLWNAMTGLLTQYEVNKNESALQAAIKCGKWLIDHFGMVTDSNHPFFSCAHDNVCNGPIIEAFVRTL